MPSRKSISHKPGRKPRKNFIILALAVAILFLGLGLYSMTQGSNYDSLTSDAAPSPQTIEPSNSLNLNPVAILGSSEARVTIIEFGEYQCPSCGFWVATEEQKIIKNLIDTGRAKLVWMDFTFYGPDSIFASEAAYAAGEQGKFWEYHDYLFSKQGRPNDGWASKENLRKYAQAVGLDLVQFDQVLESRKYLPLIQNNFESGKELGVSGTPTFFVIGPDGKGIKIEGPQPYSVFERAVESLGG